MDSFTLAMLIFIFLSCMGMHFITLTSQTSSPDPKKNPDVGSRAPIPIVPHNIPASDRILKAQMPTFAHPAVLRQNVAVARLMRMEGYRPAHH
jgi:hypothetical protein